MSAFIPDFKKYAGALLMVSGLLCFSCGALFTSLYLVLGIPAFGWRTLIPLLAGLPLIAIGGFWLKQPLRKLAGFFVYTFAYTASVLALMNIHWILLGMMTKPLSLQHHRLIVILAIETISVCLVLALPCWFWLWQNGFLSGRKGNRTAGDHSKPAGKLE